MVPTVPTKLGNDSLHYQLSRGPWGPPSPIMTKLDDHEVSNSCLYYFPIIVRRCDEAIHRYTERPATSRAASQAQRLTEPSVAHTHTHTHTLQPAHCKSASPRTNHGFLNISSRPSTHEPTSVSEDEATQRSEARGRGHRQLEEEIEDERGERPPRTPSHRNLQTRWRSTHGSLGRCARSSGDKEKAASGFGARACFVLVALTEVPSAQELLGKGGPHHKNNKCIHEVLPNFAALGYNTSRWCPPLSKPLHA